MTQTSVRITGDLEDDDLRSIANWLRAEDDLRGRVHLAVRPIEPGQMGGVVDAVSVALGRGGVAVALVRSLFGWLGQRRKGSRLRLELRDGDREVKIDIDAVQDPDAVVDKVLGFFTDGSSTL